MHNTHEFEHGGKQSCLCRAEMPDLCIIYQIHLIRHEKAAIINTYATGIYAIYKDVSQVQGPCGSF